MKNMRTAKTKPERGFSLMVEAMVAMAIGSL